MDDGQQLAGRDTAPGGWQAVAVVTVAAALMAVVVVGTGSVRGVWTVVSAVAAVLGLGLRGRC